MKKILLFLVLVLTLSFSFDRYDTVVHDQDLDLSDVTADTIKITQKVITKKKIETEDSVFIEWFKLVSKWEGGIGDRPKEEDPAGLTNHGITYYYWKTVAHKIVGKTSSREDLMSLTWAEAKVIAKSFWSTYRLNKIKDPSIRLMVAEAYWGSGPTVGLRSLGYRSINSLNRDTSVTAQILHDKRLAWLQNLDNWEHNKYGWKKRLKDDLATAKKLSAKC